MKNFKIWSFVVLVLIAMTACENGGGKKDNSKIVGEWRIESWDNMEPSFDVYIAFNEDGTFDIYQQVYSLNYEYYGGSYALAGDVLSGEYADGTAWATTYTVSVSEDRSQLTMTSQESVGVTSVYFKESIPEEIKEEAAQTRAQIVEERLF